MRKTFFLCIILISSVFAQNPEWIIYPDVKHILDLAEEGNNIWATTFGYGLAKIIKGTTTPIFYNKSNSDLPDSNLSHIAIDSSGNKWIGTSLNGLVKFDDLNWTIYNSSNSGLPINQIRPIVIDHSNNKWICTTGSGLVKFDGVNWTIYRKSNSDLPSDYVWSILVDESDNKWIGTNICLAKYDNASWTVFDTTNSELPHGGIHSLAMDSSGAVWIGIYKYGLIKYDGTNWIVFDTLNSGLPDHNVKCITVDRSGNKWIGTSYDGLAMFDDENWKIYDTSNSGLHSQFVTSVLIDNQNNKWIGTMDGLAIFNEGGVIPIKNSKHQILNNKFQIKSFQNVGLFRVCYTIVKQGRVLIKVFDTKGRIIKTLVNGFRKKGEHKIDFNTKNISNGTYFINLRAGNNSITKKIVVLK